MPALSGDWTFPTRIRFGAGRLAELPDMARSLRLRHLLVVTDRGLVATGIPRAVLDSLAAGGVAATLHAEIAENPTVPQVDAAAEAFRAAGCDGVVALGGGSGLDAGKAAALVARNPGALLRFAWPDEMPDAAPAAPIIAIPTTAGTGAEVEASSMVTDPVSATKKAIIHPTLLPAAVLADPDLTLGLPPRLTAATGMDALSHNLEALCVDSFHPMADAIALSGIALGARYLPRAVADGGDREARAYLMAAAIMGATAFGKGLGAMHALSHAIGGRLGAHHGMTNAVLMPYVLAFNAPALHGKLARVCAGLGIERHDPIALVAWIRDLNARLGIPATVAALGVEAEHVEALSIAAAADICAGTNPVPLGAAECRRLLEAARAGDPAPLAA
jgi:alcohol dehydrogenase class IV